MGYTTLKNPIKSISEPTSSFEGAALAFIRESCENLGFDSKKTEKENTEKISLGTSLKAGQIPYNMQMDINRLCLENALARFLRSGKRDDAFDVYFCYLEMFVGDYGDTRRMIELLSEFEANGSGLLMKHRDHYSHSVYVFALGLAIYYNSSLFRENYAEYYGLSDINEAACHYLEYWGLSSLFHDIGYPFELPFEEICSYFEVEGHDRKDYPYIAFRGLDDFVSLGKRVFSDLNEIYPGNNFQTINDLYAHVLTEKLGEKYCFNEKKMQLFLENKPINPNKFGHFMDHAYFSSVVLFKKLFEEIDGKKLKKDHLDALTAILMHNSLYKFCIAGYKDKDNIPFDMNLHPLAYMLMLCDELQCWDRVAYGRNSKKELHPMECRFTFSDNSIKAQYIFDKSENGKITNFKNIYEYWKKNGSNGKNKPKLKAYSEMWVEDAGEESAFVKDIKRIVDLTGIDFDAEVVLEDNMHGRKDNSDEKTGSRNYLSNSNFISLYNFAVVLNGRWSSSEWKNACAEGREEAYLSNEAVIKEFTDSFGKLSLEYKLSNINQAKAFAEYMDRIGCFYTDKQVDFEMVDGFTSEELGLIGILEHKRWLQEHYDMGWSYGDPEKSERDLFRLHKDLIPGFEGFEVTNEQAKINYDRLDKGEQDKDTDPMTCMLALLRMYEGLRIYRLK